MPTNETRNFFFTRNVSDGVGQDLSILDVEPSDLHQLSVVGAVIRDELQQQCGGEQGGVRHSPG